MLHAQLSALVIFAAALAFTGCGGSSKNTNTATTSAQPTSAQTTTTTQTATSPTTPITTAAVIKIQTGKPLSRAAWIAKGDAICAIANTKRHANSARTQAEFLRLLPQSAAYDRTEAEELSKVVPPAAKSDDWKKIVTGFQKFSEISARVAAEATSGRISEATALVPSGNSVDLEITVLAKRDGFKACSRE